MWWLNGPINAFWIAEIPFSILVHLFLSAFIWFCEKWYAKRYWLIEYIQNLNSVRRRKKICTKKHIYEMQFVANDLLHVIHFESLFDYLVRINQNKAEFIKLNFHTNSMMFQRYWFLFLLLFFLLKGFFSWKNEHAIWYWWEYSIDPFISIHLMQFVVKSASFVFTQNAFVHFCNIIRQNETKNGEIVFYVGIKFCTSKMKWKNFHQILKLWNQFSLVPMEKKTRMENKYNIKWMKIHHQAILNGATQFFSYYTM